jgi:hypothetical protein
VTAETCVTKEVNLMMEACTREPISKVLVDEVCGIGIFMGREMKVEYTKGRVAVKHENNILIWMCEWSFLEGKNRICDCADDDAVIKKSVQILVGRSFCSFQKKDPNRLEFHFSGDLRFVLSEMAQSDGREVFFYVHNRNKRLFYTMKEGLSLAVNSKKFS